MGAINTFRDSSKATIKKNGDVFRGKSWGVALAATAGTLVPFVGGAAVPAACATAYKQYKEGFGLTDEALEELANMTNKRPEDLKSFVTSRLVPAGLKVDQGEFSAAFSAAAAAATGLTIVAFVDQVADLAFPVIGAVFTAPLSIGVTYKILNHMISMQEQCATDLIEYAFSS